jgi:hypothetical protein
MAQPENQIHVRARAADCRMRAERAVQRASALPGGTLTAVALLALLESIS